jgi:D-lyxose ketol-isomerase
MKRCEINQLISEAKEFFSQHHFILPLWGCWTPEDWKGKAEECAEIAENMLGWDLTDYGSGDFKNRGLLLFTFQNENL